MAQYHLRNIVKSKHSDVNQWGIAELVDRIHVRSVFSEKRHGLTESLDGQEMNQRLIVHPTRVNQLRMG